MASKTSRPISSVALATCLLLLCGQVAAQQAATKVIKLHTERVTLYDEKGNKSDFLRENFKQPWEIKGESKNGLLPVIVEGKQYWVRPFAVETDKRIEANEDCGAVVAAREPKAGVTRGLGGEDCAKGKKK